MIGSPIGPPYSHGGGGGHREGSSLSDRSDSVGKNRNANDKSLSLEIEFFD